jgi:hypothetical protein
MGTSLNLGIPADRKDGRQKQEHEYVQRANPLSAPKNRFNLRIGGIVKRRTFERNRKTG